MKRIIAFVALALLALGAVAFANQGHDHKQGDAKKPVTLTGEVVDLYCYMQHPDDATGAGHAKCAKTCIKKGLPIGFLAVDGTLYTIIGKEHEPVGALVVDLAGTQSTITGVIIEHHGVKAIELVSVGAKAASTKAPATSAMYTCSMHPEVRQAAAGSCPKCGMTLELEAKNK